MLTEQAKPKLTGEQVSEALLQTLKGTGLQEKSWVNQVICQLALSLKYMKYLHEHKLSGTHAETACLSISKDLLLDTDPVFNCRAWVKSKRTISSEKLNLLIHRQSSRLCQLDSKCLTANGS